MLETVTEAPQERDHMVNRGSGQELRLGQTSRRNPWKSMRMERQENRSDGQSRTQCVQNRAEQRSREKGQRPGNGSIRSGLPQ